MATQAHFFIGTASNAEYLGGLWMDGHPSGWPRVVRSLQDEESFRNVVKTVLRHNASDAIRDGFSRDRFPFGWYYAFQVDRVYVAQHGTEWLPFTEEMLDPEYEIPGSAEVFERRMGWQV